jgi:hypothetical protein
MNASTSPNPFPTGYAACVAAAAPSSEIITTPPGSLTHCLGVGTGYRACGGISDTLLDVDDPEEGDPFLETPESYVIGLPSEPPRWHAGKDALLVRVESSTNLL